MMRLGRSGRCSLVSPSCSQRSTISSWLWQLQPGRCCRTANSRCFGVVTGAPARWSNVRTRETAGKNGVLSCPSGVAHISCIFLGAAQKAQMKDVQSIAIYRPKIHNPWPTNFKTAPAHQPPEISECIRMILIDGGPAKNQPPSRSDPT